MLLISSKALRRKPTVASGLGTASGSIHSTKAKRRGGGNRRDSGALNDCNFLQEVLQRNQTLHGREVRVTASCSHFALTDLGRTHHSGVKKEKKEIHQIARGHTSPDTSNWVDCEQQTEPTHS